MPNRGDKFSLLSAQLDPTRNVFNTQNGKLLLEEGLYLLEKGQIRLLNNGAEMSIQQMFEMVDLDKYRVYTMFRDAGYRLKEPEWDLCKLSRALNAYSTGESKETMKKSIEKAIRFDYHVYHTSKKVGGPPVFRLMVVPTTTCLPLLNDLDQYDNVLIALVQGGDVQLLKLGNVAI